MIGTRGIVRLAVCILVAMAAAVIFDVIPCAAQNTPEAGYELDENTGVKRPYLGQKPPGMTPELFAEGVISGKGHTHGSPAVSSDARMIYWDEREHEGSHHEIYYSRYIDSVWTRPRKVPFTKRWDGETPVLSPQGDRLFFNSRRPVSENTDSGRERVWYVEIEGDTAWSEPKQVSGAVNDDVLHWQVSLDTKGNLYFGSERSGSLGLDDIFCSAYEDGEYREAQNVGRPVNTEQHESTPFIDPDGRYLLFVRRISGKDCIHISYRGKKGVWSAPVNLTEKHPAFYGTCPRVTPDGKYVFFNRYENRRANVYWVDAKVIEVAETR